MFPYLTYFQIFASAVTSILLFFLPNIITYKTMAGLIAGISTIALCYYLFLKRFNITKVFISGLICCFIITLYILTTNFYNYQSDKYTSFLLVLGGQVFPIVLCAAVVSQFNTIQHKIKQLAPLISITFTIIAFFASFFPNSATTGGYVSTDYGLNYQSTSYLAAYAASFSFYYLISYNDITWPSLFKRKYIKDAIIFFIIINFLTILVTGGRGGLALFLVQSIFALYVYNKKRPTSTNQIFKYLGLALVAICIIFISLSFIENLPLKTNGIERIIATIEEGDQNGRDIFREKALNSFYNSPIIGHGLGSVFYEIGEYSHNCITDALVEVGLIGCIAYVLLLLKTWLKGLKLIKTDMTNSLWIIIFLNGFIMSLFSGYYISQLPMCWSITFILCYNKAFLKSETYTH